MIRTLLFFSYFWLTLLISPVFLLPFPLILRIRGKGAAHRYIRRISAWWAGHIIRITGSKIRTVNREAIPNDRQLCIVANHQGNFDIPLLMAVLPVPVRFIAKKELKHVPLISLWMRAMGCMFIDRKNPRQAVMQIQQALASMEKGEALIIFPEGTRSRSGRIGIFRGGSIQLVMRSGLTLVPVTLQNTWRLFEAKKRIGKADLSVHVHAPLETGQSEPGQVKSMTRKLRQTIQSRLERESGHG